jgi:hypothetical protein
MRPMVLTRSSRSVVALVTAVLLLLCQTAFAAQACAHSFAPAIADAASAPCHETPSDAGMPAKQAPAVATGCEAAKAVADPAKLTVFAVTDLPAVLLTYYESAAPTIASVAPQTAQAVCYSPPLSILHCRLLN